ncbi:MAG: tRNA 2-selenouridine(34) synthase MnmH [Thainema sp.]
MSLRTTAIDDFLTANGTVLDVRSPGEYEQGHIPGAVSFPLFDNDERAQIGTCYKQVGHEAAVELGLEIAGPKAAGFVRRAKELAADGQVRVHCWRGGMRSENMAYLLQMAGFQVQVLTGGYKAFRRWVRQQLAEPKPIITLGGMTGTGKTSVLKELEAQGEQILDLEGNANNRGSSYGSLGMPPQPSTEHFENLVALDWAACDATKPTWIEAESRRVGTCRVPDELFRQMMAAPVLEIVRSRSERIQLLIDDYGDADPHELIAATQRIKKRLGGERTQAAIASIEANDPVPAIDLVLDYYDKTYRYDLERRPGPIYSLDVTGQAAEQVAAELIQKARFYELAGLGGCE